MEVLFIWDVQYGFFERFLDYARAFHSVVQYAIDHKAEFILISGDLFHKRNINAIEGNRDLAFHQDGKSWLEIINSQGLLKLIRLKEANGAKLMGDFLELENVRNPRASASAREEAGICRQDEFLLLSF